MAAPEGRPNTGSYEEVSSELGGVAPLLGDERQGWAPSAARGRARLLALPAALLLGLAAWRWGAPTAVAQLLSRDDVEFGVKVEAPATPRRSKMMVEMDLVHLLKGELSTESAGHAKNDALKAPKKGQDCRERARALFEDVAKRSGLDSELQGAESEAFKHRFAVAMELGCKTLFTFDTESWLDNARKEFEAQKPIMTQAVASSLNGASLTFQVEMRGWMVDLSKAGFASKLGRKATPAGMKDILADPPRGSLRGGEPEAPIPERFDAREQWPKCAGVIGTIHNQGHCGSCWVFGALGALDSRLCIATDGNFSGESASLSRGYATSCAARGGDGCQGGFEYWVYQYLDHRGHEGVSTECVPYFASGAGVEHFNQKVGAPACPSQCQAQYPRPMAMDRFKTTGVSNFQQLLDPSELIDGKREKLEQVKRAIMTEGPCPMAIYASYAFMGYSQGVYALYCGHTANHAVHAIGWGSEHGKAYVLGQNSWGPDWGDAGRFKIAECEVAEVTIPGTIKITNVPMPEPALLSA